VEIFGVLASSQEIPNLVVVQGASNRRSIVLANLACNELPEISSMFIAAVLARRFRRNTSSLTTIYGWDVIAPTHALPSGEQDISLALRADETIEKLFGIVLVDTDT
jgi:hypothetical protein